jgi:mannosyltransferase OCH1-like enzyme
MLTPLPCLFLPLPPCHVADRQRYHARYFHAMPAEILRADVTRVMLLVD